MITTKLKLFNPATSETTVSYFRTFEDALVSCRAIVPAAKHVGYGVITMPGTNLSASCQSVRAAE